jgi:hypothetical protein
MKKVFLIAILVFFVHAGYSQQPSTIRALLLDINSLEEVADLSIENSSTEISKLIISDNSLSFNDSMFSYLGYYYFSDTSSIYSHVETMVIGEIKEFDLDSLTIYHKLVAVDSVLCYNVATIELGYNYQYIDSVFDYVKNSLNNEIEWNSIPYHFTDTYNTTGIKGGLGWIEKDIYGLSFTSAIDNHDVNEVFIFRDEQGECYGTDEYSCIVNKLDKARYFKRYHVIQVSARGI